MSHTKVFFLECPKYTGIPICCWFCEDQICNEEPTILFSTDSWSVFVEDQSKDQTEGDFILGASRTFQNPQLDTEKGLEYLGHKLSFHRDCFYRICYHYQIDPQIAIYSLYTLLRGHLPDQVEVTFWSLSGKVKKYEVTEEVAKLMTLQTAQGMIQKMTKIKIEIEDRFFDLLDQVIEFYQIASKLYHSSDLLSFNFLNKNSILFENGGLPEAFMEFFCQHSKDNLKANYEWVTNLSVCSITKDKLYLLMEACCYYTAHLTNKKTVDELQQIFGLSPDPTFEAEIDKEVHSSSSSDEKQR